MRQSQGVALASDDMHNTRNSAQPFYSCRSIPKFPGAKSKMLKSCWKRKNVKKGSNLPTRGSEHKQQQKSIFAQRLHKF